MAGSISSFPVRRAPIAVAQNTNRPVPVLAHLVTKKTLMQWIWDIYSYQHIDDIPSIP